ncbi:hypothetical protein ABNM12_12850 [Pseudomonas syringae]|uniref:Uncharacterized protein n=1 Tax=Pseudomonas syringae pv. apii TaxID=81036 RepID=A0A3M5WNB9_9PSED|nr:MULTISPECIES: hypothetical protein [Pseudomonas]MDY2565893.1 hypothetical protein [Pseudomonas syringae]RMU71936.1 hypothetical protein ALP23_03471 [Pseudomonas syringae pv. apii]
MNTHAAPARSISKGSIIEALIGDTSFTEHSHYQTPFSMHTIR